MIPNSVLIRLDYFIKYYKWLGKYNKFFYSSEVLSLAICMLCFVTKYSDYFCQKVQNILKKTK